MNEGIRVAQVGDIDDGEGLKIDRTVTGTLDDIAVFFDAGEYFALNDTCSHAQASLSEGWVEDGIVECPLHNGKFCLKTGAVESMPPVEPVLSHHVEVDGDDIRVIPNPESLAP
jgi:3-phenylpropionate/trans-cinnamate dioxygenase ferredoxin subunit